MPQTTVEAFNWSANGYNSTYNSSVTAVLDDDDGVYEGGGDADETISINGGPFLATNSTPWVLNVSFTDTNGDTFTEEFYFFNTGGSWYFIPTPGSTFGVGATLGSFQGISSSTGYNYDDVICFTQGTKITTPTGRVNAEDLRAGDLVITRDNGIRPIRWIGTKNISGARLHAFPHLRPIKIKAHSFGPNTPATELMVSPQHRMFLKSTQAQMMFGEAEVLVPAKGLLNDNSVTVDNTLTNTTYIHILFDQHELVMANGAWSESFHPGEASFDAIEQGARAELFELFPELWSNPDCFGASARLSLKARDTVMIAQNALIAR